MTSFYTPFLILLSVAALIPFHIAKLKVSDISFMLGIMLVYIVLNNLLIFLFSPDHGTTIYGIETVLFPIAGPYVVTAEQLEQARTEKAAERGGFEKKILLKEVIEK